MRIVHIHGRRYAQFERLGVESGLVHAFATRPLNVAPHDGPDADQRAANRATLAADLGFDPRRLAFCQQVHQTTLVVVDKSHRGGPLGECDGVVTALLDTPLLTFSADCPLILVFDPRQRVLGLVHASWRCTVARLAEQLILLMSKSYACRPADLLAGIGPGAGPCCYEVQDDVYQAAGALTDREQFFGQHDGRLFFDLWAANRAQLLAAGLSAGNIECAAVCTLCRNDVFYSYRREGPDCGHFGLMAGLRPT
jgi:YfiH family protein